MKGKRGTIYTLAPFTFLVTMTIWALLVQLRGYWEQGNMLLVVMDLVILITTIWVGLEALGALNRARRGAEDRATV